MKVAAVKTQKGLIGISSLLVLVFALLPAASVSADTYPYIKVYGGDVAAGGAFGPSCTAPGIYQSGGNNGGILTFAKTPGGGNSATGGSSGQYGVFADGNIDNSNGSGGTPDGGFYSGAAQGGTNVSRLSFASIGGSGWGGNFDGGTPSGDQCIPDYYGAGTSQSGVNTVASMQTAQGKYLINNDLISPALIENGLPATIISGNPNIQIYVNGDVYIGSNICYAPGCGGEITDSSADSTPQFTLVANGNIYIGKDVTQLDGWYIAEPNLSTGKEGVIWTCHEQNKVDPEGYVFQNSCTNKLIVNGALTAASINFGRIPPSSNVPTSGTGSDGPGPSFDSNASEIINYDPGLILNGGGFSRPPSSPKTEKLISLPPVF